jgi:hypothetical protein
MNYLKISGDTHINVLAISSVRFFKKELVREATTTDGMKHVPDGYKKLAEIIMTNGKEYTIEDAALDEIRKLTGIRE